MFLSMQNSDKWGRFHGNTDSTPRVKLHPRYSVPYLKVKELELHVYMNINKTVHCEIK
jgi:hypothetical protein